MRIKLPGVRFGFIQLGLALLFATALSSAAGAVTFNRTYGANFAAASNGTGSTAQQFTGAGSWRKVVPPGPKFETYFDVDTQFEPFTVSQIQSVTYHTNNSVANPSNVDFYMLFYTKTTGSGDDGSFYHHRLIGEPIYSNGYVAPTVGVWNTWTTPAGPNQLTFFDSNHCGNQGFNFGPTLADLQAGPIDWSTWPANPNNSSQAGGATVGPYDYSNEPVRYVSFQTGSGWASFDGYLDAITINLTNGNSYTIDLEAAADPIYVDDNWAGFPPGTSVGPGKVIGVNSAATINGGIALASNGGTVNVAPGTYPEDVVLGKSLTMLGSQHGVPACGRVAGAPDPATESVITGAPASVRLWQLITGSAGSVIDGFSFSGASRQIESTSGPINALAIKNNHFAGFTGNAIYLNDNGIDITVDNNNINAGSQTAGGGSIHLDQDGFAGFYLTNNCIGGTPTAPNGSGLFVDGNHNVGVSANRTPLIDNNVFENHATGVGANLGSRAFTGGTISNNKVRNNAADGIQGGIQNTTIRNNLFANNGRNGLVLTSFGNMGADRGGQNVTVTGNTFSGNGFTNTGSGYAISATQVAGNAASCHANQNDIASRARPANAIAPKAAPRAVASDSRPSSASAG